MKFLSIAASKALKPKESLVALLKKKMGGYQPERSHNTVHASDVTKPEFCARQYALLDATGKQRSPVFISAALQATFDHGHAISDLIREQWLGDAAIGNWRCLRCHAHRSFCSRPTEIGCNAVGSDVHIWKYREVEFKLPYYGVSGSIDVFTDLGSSKVFPTECKIMAPQEWEKIVAPLAEHRLRTSLYLYLIRESNSPYKDKINTNEGWVLYVSRAYGKKHGELNEVLPFKAFKIPRDDQEIPQLLAKGRLVQAFREVGIMPQGICGSSADKFAKKCPVSKECFSGNYPYEAKCVS